MTPRARIFLFATLLSAIPASPARACSVEELRRSPRYEYRVERVVEFVDSAEVIVRVLAAGVDSTVRRPTVLFTPVEWIRGGPSAVPLRADGELVERDDFAAGPVPYTTVRPAGQHGDCYAREYRRGAEYLLLLRPRGTEKLSPYWVALAPLNQQVRGAADPWVIWVRTRVRTTDLKGRSTELILPDSSPLTVGALVRLTLARPPPDEITGRLLERDAELLRVASGRRTITVPWDAVGTLEVGTARPRWVGGLRWGIAGALMGGIVGATGGRPGAPQRKHGAARDGLAAGGGAGVALGIVFGRVRWTNVPLPERRNTR